MGKFSEGLYKVCQGYWVIYVRAFGDWPWNGLYSRDRALNGPQRPLDTLAILWPSGWMLSVIH